MLTGRDEDIDCEALDAAHERGVQEALRFLARIEETEEAERKELIAQWKCLSNGGRSPSPGCADAAMILRLKSENEGLRQFRHAVLHSKGWRLLQLARRLVGRAW